MNFDKESKSDLFYVCRGREGSRGPSEYNMIISILKGNIGIPFELSNCGG